MKQAQRPKYFSPAADLASRILELLSRYRTKEGTLTEISNALGASKATCLRVLKTLVWHRLVRYDERTRRYSLGIQSVVVGIRAEENIDYLLQLRPYLREAAEKTDMTAVLVQQVSYDRMMYVAKQESDSRARVTVSVGNRFPITGVSYGKWLLAYASAEEREAVLAEGLRQHTEATVTDLDDYRAQLKAIRDAGVLISREEYVPGICAVSCPVLDHEGRFLGVIAVLGFASACDDDMLASVVETMREIGQRYSQGGGDVDRV
ncbi:MAG: helix-turn-helix domain-containing protein [Streptosporangiales bacterium]|nr:helix-turn-helix domain-containing protein [Streptosporangiales bacterium]